MGRWSGTMVRAFCPGENADFILNISEIFATIVYNQLVFEKAKIEGIEGKVIDQVSQSLFLFRDFTRNSHNAPARHCNG
jgi:hypothetical protein